MYEKKFYEKTYACFLLELLFRRVLSDFFWARVKKLDHFFRDEIDNFLAIE